MSEATIDLHDLRLCVEQALEMLATDRTVVEAEVCASWGGLQSVRVQYDTERPDDGIQAPRLEATYGVGIFLVLEDQQGRRIGFGSDRDDLSVEGITLALERAKASAVHARHLRTLPRPPALPSPAPTFHDPEVVALYPDEVRHLALEALDGALSTLKAAGYVTTLQVGGEVSSRAEHMVVGNTHGLLAAETSTGLSAAMLCRLPRERSQGTGSSVAAYLTDFAPQDAGAEAAQQALRMRGSIPLPAGDYPVIFGPPAVADLMQEILIPALSLDTVAARSSPFLARFGQQVTAALLTIADAGRLPRLLGSRAMTGEGISTGTTPLIEQGRLVGFLADSFYAQLCAPQFGRLAPQNGMRFALRGESFGMPPGIFPTNIVLTGTHPEPLDALLATISDGIYIGGLWNTVPVGGLQSGAFTSTVASPAYHIRHGQLAAPLRPGTLRLQDNYLDLLHRLTGVSTTPQAIALATTHSLVVTPDLRCSQAHFVL